MSEHRELTPEEFSQVHEMLTLQMYELMRFVEQDPACRRAVAKCLMGSAIAVCETFGVNSIKEAVRIRMDCGVVDELTPPTPARERN